MNPLLTLAIGFFGGFLLVLVSGLAMPQRFFSMGMGILNRAVLVKRENGGWWLRASAFANGMETVGDQEWKDELGEMGRLYGKPFGIAHEKRRIIYSPRMAEVGEFFQKRVQNARQSFKHDGGYYENGFIAVPWGEDRAVDPDGILSLLVRSGDPEQNDRIDDFVEWGQEMFGESTMGDWIKPIAAFLLVYGGMFLVSYVMEDGGGGGGGGGGGTSLPMDVAATAVDVVVIAPW